jgi:hypothetical protein
MKSQRIRRIWSLFAAVFVLAAAASAQQAALSSIIPKDMSQAEVDRIIRKVTENESQFRSALTNYVFNRSATVQTVGLGGNITGTYRRDSFMTFSEDGARFEKVTFNPVSSLTEIQITPEDLEDLGGVNPFALDPSAVASYNFTFVGMEKIDELDLYVFDVRPKVMPDPKKSKIRLFNGRIWVDKDDLLIVKSKGKAVPETKDNKFPVVETYRENIDGKYWFPTYVTANDELVFNSGQVVHIKMNVKYTNYRQGRSDVRILDDDTPVKPDPAPSPTPKKP